MHTAGNSSQISDGAAAVMIATEDKASALGLTPRARIVDSCLVGTDPVLMLTGPIDATKHLLARTGLSIDDIDVFEINEAFASVVLAWAKEVGADLDKTNPNGGAIALGHPLGATGAFLMTKALYELERTGGRYAPRSRCAAAVASAPAPSSNASDATRLSPSRAPSEPRRSTFVTTFSEDRSSQILSQTW